MYVVCIYNCAVDPHIEHNVQYYNLFPDISCSVYPNKKYFIDLNDIICTQWRF